MVAEFAEGCWSSVDVNQSVFAQWHCTTLGVSKNPPSRSMLKSGAIFGLKKVVISQIVRTVGWW